MLSESFYRDFFSNPFAVPFTSPVIIPDLSQKYPVVNALPPAQTELKDLGDKFILTVYLAGVDEDDLNVQMKNNPNQQLHIEWNRQPTSGESSRFLHSNIQYGKFKLVHTFDAIVLSKKVISTYENGILRVTIPKDNSQPFIVPINGKVKDNSPDK